MSGLVKKGLFISLLCLMPWVQQCGSSAAVSSSSTSSGTASITSISDLPTATGPVVSTTTDLMGGMKYLAETGMSFGESQTFESGDSISACEMYNNTKEVLRSAAQGDKILCYIQQIFESTDQSIDIYDGEYHTFTVAFDGEEEGEGGDALDHVRFRVVKTGDSITGFTMFACGGGQVLEYINQTIGSDGSFSMVSQGIGGGGDSEYAHDVSVSGTLSGSNFVGTKTINIAHTWTDTTYDLESWGEATVLQTDETFRTSGYSTGAHFNGEGINEYSSSVYAVGQIVDHNTDGSDYDLRLLGLGDGAIQGTNAGSYTSDTSDDFSWNEMFSESWLGDTKGVTASNDFTDLAAAGTAPDVSSTPPTIEVAADEDYNCDAEPEGDPLAVDEEALMTGSCAALDLNFEWVNCYQSTQPQE